MSLFKILRGDSSRISPAVTPFRDGYAYFTPDDGRFYIDAIVNNTNNRVCINPSRKVEVMSVGQPSTLSAGDDWDQVLG